MNLSQELYSPAELCQWGFAAVVLPRLWAIEPPIGYVASGQKNGAIQGVMMRIMLDQPLCECCLWVDRMFTHYIPDLLVLYGPGFRLSDAV